MCSPVSKLGKIRTFVSAAITEKERDLEANRDRDAERQRERGEEKQQEEEEDVKLFRKH